MVLSSEIVGVNGINSNFRNKELEVRESGFAYINDSVM